MILPGPTGAVAAAVTVPPSKSLTNRALIGCAVANGGVVREPLDSDDTRVLAGALRDAGWAVDWSDVIRVGERSASEDLREIWLGDSGTGARLMLALLAATPGRFRVDGSLRLRERPMEPLLDALRRLGVRCSCEGDRLPIELEGALLNGGQVTVRPEVSSQFVSALMLSAPLMADGLDIIVDGQLPSRPYVRLTTDTLARLGVAVAHRPGSDRWRVPGGRPAPTEIAIEGDWSAAAFFVAAAAVAGGWVEIRPLSLASTQGDRSMCAIIEAAGVAVREVPDGVRIEGPARRPLGADVIDAPDLFPALAAVAATGPAGSTISGLDHLRHKESDRLSAMVDNLTRLGAELRVSGTKLTVETTARPGGSPPRPVASFSDHRIAMAMAVVSLAAGPLELDDPGCVSKSFPSFWEIWEELASATTTVTPRS